MLLHRSNNIFRRPSRSALNEKLFGSTTKTLTEKVDIPILIFRPQLVSTFRESELAQRCQNLFKYVLVPYDGSDSAKKLVGTVQTQLQSDPAGALETCLLVSVVDDGGRLASNNPEAEAQEKLDAAKAELSNLGSEILTEVRIGNPVEEVLKSGETHDISAIAVCSGKSKGLLNFTVPSFTSAILRESWHPIVHFPRL
ncbi:MAG: universal stress protein [Cyanobacteria bacterium J06576_12]